ncbi:NAD-dependent epimerase/dehydratase family protein [Pedobacter aquatilis]|uniref:NAD-dependent epimerase/dehydratase family protein n=1 Tax=Pedobacter aquatilis TaxID=351343 RepID=UPI00292F1969|nr:NAD-dependent epimerase/dehydratase family protein [Pedobacter aquatilis]
MNAYITGSTGFVGKHLSKYLNDYGLDVKAINRQELNEADKLFFTKDSSIIHLAGKAHDLKRTAKIEEYYEVNFELTKTLYDAFLKSEATMFIFVSSVKAVADSLNSPLTEEVIANPKTPYGKSKHMAENYIINQPLPNGKTYYILRPCMIHGPGNKGNLNLLYKFVKKSVPYPLASFVNQRSFLSIENLCFVIANMLKKNIPSGVFNVADDVALSTNQVVEILANSMNKKPKLLAIPQSYIRLLARIGDIFRLPLNSERLYKLTENYVVSNKKIKQALNLELPISVEHGLAITAKSFEA